MSVGMNAMARFVADLTELRVRVACVIHYVWGGSVGAVFFMEG